MISSPQTTSQRYMAERSRAVLSSFGRFHMYSIARSLFAEDALAMMFTADLNRPPNLGSLVNRFPLALSGAAYVAGRSRFLRSTNQWFCSYFDRWVERRLPQLAAEGASIFHGLSSFCLASLAKARQEGMIPLVDRCCPHITVQRRLLEEETALLKVNARFEDDPYFRQASKMVEEYDRAKYILTCSEFSRRSFLDCGFAPERVISIPLGANFPPTKIPRTLASPFRVLCVGTNPYRKGVYYLIDAWQRAKLPNAELILRTPIVPTIAQMIHDPTIKILGPLSRDRLVQEYKAATVFCLPSIDDGFGMVVLEAMSFGLPVIVSTHVGAGEIIRPGIDGLVFPVRNVGALEECLVRLHSNRDEALAMGESALTRSQEFTWKRYGKELLKFYRKAIATAYY